MELLVNKTEEVRRRLNENIRNLEIHIDKNKNESIGCIIRSNDYMFKLISVMTEKWKTSILEILKYNNSLSEQEYGLFEKYNKISTNFAEQGYLYFLFFVTYRKCKEITLSI